MHLFANTIVSSPSLKTWAHTCSPLAISPAENNELRRCLSVDAMGLFYSSYISLCEGINGFKKGLPTWASVKMYYSAFYAARATLCSSGIGIVYINNKAKIIDLNKSTSLVEKGSDNSHKLVIKKYDNPSKPLNQPINLSDPLDWLMTIREKVNYKNCKFPDPVATEVYWNKIVGSRIIQNVENYIEDASDLYTYDEEHALVAFPLKFFTHNYRRSNIIVTISNDEDVLCQELLPNLYSKLIPIIKKI